MNRHVHVPDRAAYDEASELIDCFGEAAADEAALRADKSRDLGNVILFCRWRSVERTIRMLDDRKTAGPVH